MILSKSLSWSLLSSLLLRSLPRVVLTFVFDIVLKAFFERNFEKRLENVSIVWDALPELDCWPVLFGLDDR